MSGPLTGLRVLDLSTLFAGPMAAMHMGDLGASVVKVEHPQKPDPSRRHGASKDGHNLWWPTLGRNKSTITANLSTGGGQQLLLDLAKDSDVIIENFRPGTLEKWNLGYDHLSRDNPGLVLARVTGFGQFGPYSRRPGFGTLAEAMSGFAAGTGEPDGPPTLPPFGLADGIASYACAFAVMAALRERDDTGLGQVVDLSIVEPILSVLGPQITHWDQLRTIPARQGNRSSNNAPRNTYECSDGQWVAVSSSADSIAGRVMKLVGREDLVEEPWFGSGAERALHEEVDASVADWIRQRPREVVLAEFERVEAAIAPIYTQQDIYEDPQLRALGAVIEVVDPNLGQIAMQNSAYRFSRTPGEVRHGGRGHGQDTNTVLTQLGYSAEDIAELRRSGDIL